MAQNRHHQNHHQHSRPFPSGAQRRGVLQDNGMGSRSNVGDLGLMEQWSRTPITYLLQLECLQLWTIGHHGQDEHSAHSEQRRDVLARWKYGHASLRLKHICSAPAWVPSN